jgi:ATP-dependent Lhr-like helicase
VFDAFFGRHLRLLPAQETAIPLIAQGKNLLLISSTGSGKTEAVVAPIAERALDFRGQTYALYVCPTKALINDLEMRLKSAFEQLGLRLAIRHGDRATIRGKQAPSIIVTTPESLDVMLSTNNPQVTERLREVRAVIVDEVHQLYATRRGFQLKILLERLKHTCHRPLQRLFLSATVAEPEAVARYFQGTDTAIETVNVGSSRRLQLTLDLLPAESVDDFRSGKPLLRLLEPIVENHRKILMFANTRNECDWLYWKLHEQLKTPVFLHYSSLHKDYREQVEQQFRRERRGLCIATSTLELGIDIGDVDAVVMYGAPNTVSSFMQRLGRGNRRSDESIVYCICRPFHVSGAPADADEDLLYFVALTHAALRSELEERHVPEYYSVFVQQFFALACKHGKVTDEHLSQHFDSQTLAFASNDELCTILHSLENNGLLRYRAAHDVYYPEEPLHRLINARQIWANIASRSHVIVVGEDQVPRSKVPRRYASGLRAGQIVLFAGKPRLVTRVEDQAVWTVELRHDDPQMPRYFTPAEPTPVRVAEAIREVLTDGGLTSLPVSCDDWCWETIQRWRRKFTGMDLSQVIAFGFDGGRTVYYTFLYVAHTKMWILNLASSRC